MPLGRRHGTRVLIYCLLLASSQITGQVIPVTPVTIENCDFDGNLVVGFADFIAFSGAYGTTDVTYDLNHSGLVDFPDFLILVEHWGNTYTEPFVPYPAGPSITRLSQFDTLRVGVPEILSVRVFWGERAGDVRGYNLGILGSPDSILVDAEPSDGGDWQVTVTALGDAGDHRLWMAFASARDTLDFVVVP